MKILLAGIVVVFMSLQVFSQSPPIPQGTPGKVSLPTPVLQPVPPADLTIPGLTFVSIVFNAEAKTYLIKVIATISNTGGVQSNKTQVQAYSKSPSGSGSWKAMPDKGNVLVIDPGKTFSSVYTFLGSVLDIGTVSFDFRLKVDPGEIVTESDKLNNYSSVLVINPRAH